MPKCKINGHEIEVKPGQTIIEAFKKMEQEIAHYCWHPGLSIAGVCRLCMVEIEGMPKLQIACNTEVRDGMVITNQSEKVKEAVRWGLDFHLINHPLDCPICDQAGECGLQEQYMAFGKYDPAMAEPKVKKRKVVDLGPTIVLDTERCILCSRCVRFTDEISKTHELGIFNRGDRSEIGTFEDKPLANNYSLNTVDICPVGALTSKDFRFRQRVWYLKEADSICPGCSTGCNVKVYHNEEGLWRVKPRHNPDVNGYWMCDEGRDTYKYVNAPNRLMRARSMQGAEWSELEAGAALQDVHQALTKALQEHGPEKVAVVMTGQQTCEEYEDFLTAVTQGLEIDQVYHWINHKESFDDFDGLLLRGDKNPNTKGLLQSLEKFKLVATWTQFEEQLASGDLKFVMVVGPENQKYFPEMDDLIQKLSTVDQLVWFTSNPVQKLETRLKSTWMIPLKTYIEKDGSFINFQGKKQSWKRGTTVVPGALTLSEVAQLIVGDTLSLSGRPDRERFIKTNFFTLQRGAL